MVWSRSTGTFGSAVAMASRLVSPDGGRVHLLHVIETIPGFSLGEERDFYEKLEKAATKHLRELSKPLAAAGVGFDAEVVYGPRAKSILDEATRLEADPEADIEATERRIKELGGRSGAARAEPGWYPDPERPSKMRWWDGNDWSDPSRT